MPEGVPDAMRELRRMFRKPTNSTFDTNRKGQLFEILMGQRLVMQEGFSESLGSLETDGRNGMVLVRNQKKSACFCSLFGIASADHIQAKGIRL